MDYNENVEYKRSRNRPKTAYAKVKEKIAEKIKEITELNQALTIHNRLKDRISVDDVSEIEDLLDDTDSEEEISLVDEIQTEENQNLNVDPSFSLEYGYVDDVSSLWFVILNEEFSSWLFSIISTPGTQQPGV